MGKRSSGLNQAPDGTWIVDKRVLGQRIYKRIGSSDRKIAEAYLVQQEVEIR